MDPQDDAVLINSQKRRRRYTVNGIIVLGKQIFQIGMLAVDSVVGEFFSYSKKVKISIFILLIFAAGFAFAGLQVILLGLGFTDLNNIMGWGIWIAGDLSLIVLGGGAFFTSFILYIFRRDEFQPIINSAILIGLLCYAFTFMFLLFDVGQPLRVPFAYIYPNWGEHLLPNSMLTEVIFCITLYFTILVIEFTPIVLEHPFLDKNPIIHKITHYMHKLMWIAAAVGTFLSFFHQGSLGGTYGILFAKPGWYRPEVFTHIPHTFFIFVLSAVSVGPSFTVLVTWFAGKMKKVEVVPFKTYVSLARVSGFMFIIYFIYRMWDVYSMSAEFVPLFDRSYLDLWGGPFGLWMLVLELVACFIPVILLNIRKFRETEKTLIIGVGSATLGMIMNRVNATIHGFSVPNFPWKEFQSYSPTVQEWFLTLGIFASMALVYMLCSKYLPLYPNIEKQEKVA
ncbi:MAG: NrfD/PsrC family molybdoenzyme membrane anchor subunit [Spirochaetota bacterium]|nr:NrfD/PsrC family molybdoenzyme membrane anchor subunit [Spirochaetota bacterium]